MRDTTGAGTANAPGAHRHHTPTIPDRHVVGPRRADTTITLPPEVFDGRTPRRLDVGVDVDGPLYDFPAAVRAYLIGVEGTGRRMPEPTRWHFYRDWGLTDEQFSAVCHRGVDSGIVFRTGTPVPGSVEAVQQLMEDGHRVHLITDRAEWGSPGAAEQATREWLAEHAVPFTTLTLSRDKTVVPTDVMVDDRTDHYEALEAAGTTAYLLDTVWNRHHDARRRVHDMSAFARAVRACAANESDQT
ncbi:hypothetical protein [Saccharothrix sp.]|uniref:5' nucleotidase, NT5C type n=1 Tax=Saccharothrix sp. TaxID=1873460 RepID=UPI0028127246|nr:hypothetical protein [Saccharothrix sp.]